MVNPGEPWWKEYRRQQFKVRRVSIELLLRKSLKDAAKEYMTCSSLSCVSELSNTKSFAKYRAILFVVFCSLLGATCYFTVYTISNTLTKPLIVSMESSTYPISKIDFPAVTLCNVNRISKKALLDYAKRVYKYLALHNESLTEVENWLYQYGRLLDFTWDDNLGTHPFMDIRSKYHINTSAIFGRMKKFAPKCEEMLLKCYWAAQQYNCTELFQVRRTFRGHCCVFNYVLDYNAGGRPRKTIADVKRQEGPGPLRGLTVLVDPLIEDYAYPLRNIHGFDVFLSDPAVYLDPYVGRVVHRVLETNNAMYIELQSIKQMATAEVRKYPLSTRNCLFRDESPMYGDMYSYATCLIHCRIKSVQSLCKCTPFFLPTNILTTELCTMEKLRCLNKYKEKLLYIFPKTQDTKGLEMEQEDSLYCPECLPDCEFTKHFTRVSKLPIILDDEYRTKEFMRLLYKDLNSTNKSILSIYQTSSDGTLDRLDVVSYWFEVLSVSRCREYRKKCGFSTDDKCGCGAVQSMAHLLSCPGCPGCGCKGCIILGNFGGFAGVVIGFSIISVCEILYFFSIRFCQQFYVNYKRYR